MRKTLLVGVLVTLLVGPAFAQSTTSQPNNSGAGVQGMPGNKNGPAANSSGGSNATTQQQDPSKIQGLPGNKSGPSTKAPKD
jgi:hypothetical protein